MTRPPWLSPGLIASTWGIERMIGLVPNTFSASAARRPTTQPWRKALYITNAPPGLSLALTSRNASSVNRKLSSRRLEYPEWSTSESTSAYVARSYFRRGRLDEAAAIVEVGGDPAVGVGAVRVVDSAEPLDARVDLDGVDCPGPMPERGGDVVTRASADDQDVIERVARLRPDSAGGAVSKPGRLFAHRRSPGGRCGWFRSCRFADGT